MKANKLFRLFMAICISFSLIGATSIQAQENNIKISEDGFAIVYADLNNELEVKMEAQKAFDAGATVVKVENNAVKPRSSDGTATQLLIILEMFYMVPKERFVVMLLLALE